ncbi:MAG TPA: TonB-dependent receptor, partial [Paludibacteraceae bacterium]|nr:TonB-dependent receptor [Paludibacteraceae bacterium]
MISANFKHILSFTGISLLSGIFMTVYGQNPPDQKKDTTRVHYIQEIVVTESTRNAEIRSSTPLQILSSKSLTELNALQVSDAVKQFSGVTVKDYGGIGGLKTVSVRSLGANHTTVSYDGIALTDVQSGQIDIGRFSLENVDMISLSSGQSDNIFQPARLFASASVLNIQTLSPEFRDNRKMNGKVALKAGSFGLINPSLTLNRKFNQRLSASFSGEWLAANGEYPYRLNYGFAGKDSSSMETRRNTDVNNLRLEAALHAAFSDKSRGYIKTYFYQSERGLPGATIYYNLTNFSTQRIWDNTFFTQAHYQHELSRKWEIQANAKYNRGYLRYLDPVVLNSDGKTENTYVQNEIYGSVSTLFRAFENISFSASSDVSGNTLDAAGSGFASPSRLSWLTVLAGKYVSNRVLATASLLYTHINEQTKTGDTAENQRKFSPYISLSVKPFTTADLRFRAFYKNIFRVPTFNDLYYSRVGNPNLKPENTQQFNLGATYTTTFNEFLQFLSVTADAYHNRIDNKIVAYPTKNIFEWTMLNYGRVDIDGLDFSLEAAYRIAKGYNLIAGGSYTYQRALNVTNPDDRDYNQQIPYTPRVSGSGRASLETPWINLNYSTIWSGHRYAVNQNYA